MNNEKKLHQFSYSKSKKNFEAFHQVISSSINLLILKSDYLNINFRLCCPYCPYIYDYSRRKWKCKSYSNPSQHWVCSNEWRFQYLFSICYHVYFTISFICDIFQDNDSYSNFWSIPWISTFASFTFTTGIQNSLEKKNENHA